MSGYGVGKKDEWYTPPEIFDALGIVFDLDPCHPYCQTYVRAEHSYTEKDDGLKSDWFGNVWLNPPFGSRNGYFPWLDKFIKHGNGIGLITALTSSEGFHKYMPQMDSILFPERKTVFYESYGTKGGNPFNGIVLFAMGKENSVALKRSGLGMYFDVIGEKL